MAQVVYVKIENDIVINRHVFDNSDVLKIVKLVAHGYKERNDTVPSYNPLYESVSLDNPEWVEVAGKWKRQYIVSEIVSIADAKTIKRGILRQEGISHFREKYNYFDLAKMIRSGSTPQFNSDYDAVEGHFISKRNEINTCADIACVKTVEADWPII